MIDLRTAGDFGILTAEAARAEWRGSADSTGSAGSAGSAELSSEHAALLSPTTHEYRGGLYWDHGASPPLPGLLTHRGNECDPPAETPNGSSHLLLPPGPRGRTLPLVMRWVARERAWARPGGNRMAFTAEYLAHNGWWYLRPQA